MRHLAYTIAATLLALIAANGLAWAVIGRGELPAMTPEAWPEWAVVDSGDSLIVHTGVVLDGDSVTVYGLSTRSVGRAFEGVRASAGDLVGVRVSPVAHPVGSGAIRSPEGVAWRLTVLPFDPWPLTRDVSVSLFKPMDLDESLGISYGHRERYVYVFGWRRVWASALGMA